MLRSALFCLAGLLIGVGSGFFVANNSAPVTAVAPAPARPNNGAAPPLDPNQTSGELPPNHPSVEGGPGAANSGPDKSGGAAGSTQVQGVMDAADRNAKDFAAQMRAAVAFYNNSAYDKAELYLKRALAVKPNDVDALTGMGNTKYDQNDFVAAQGYYEKVLAQKKDPDIQTDLGNTFFKRDEFARAIAEYRKAVTLNPQHEKAWQNMAAAALRQGDKTTAREAVDKLAAVNPQNPSLASLRQSVAQ